MTMIAIDSATDRRLSPEEATAAADNPMIHKWVVWVDEATAAQHDAARADRYHNSNAWGR